MIQYMFGVVAFGDRQYKIIPGEACIFEKIEGSEGDKISINNLILISDGSEVVLEKSRLDRYIVEAEIVKQYRDSKVISFKKKRRKDYTNKRGHRQYKTLVLIKNISLRSWRCFYYKRCYNCSSTWNTLFSKKQCRHG